MGPTSLDNMVWNLLKRWSQAAVRPPRCRWAVGDTAAMPGEASEPADLRMLTLRLTLFREDWWLQTWSLDGLALLNSPGRRFWPWASQMPSSRDKIRPLDLHLEPDWIPLKRTGIKSTVEIGASEKSPNTHAFSSSLCVSVKVQILSQVYCFYPAYFKYSFTLYYVQWHLKWSLSLHLDYC